VRGLGTIINTATVLVGGSVGYFIGHRIKDSIRTIVVQVIGLATLVMGISNVMDTQNLVFPPVGRQDSAYPSHCNTCHGY